MHGYCRLSRDEDKENYSSIEEQKRIIKEYASTRNWNIDDKDFYIDDNVSGYTFNRAEFTKMWKKTQKYLQKCDKYHKNTCESVN